jgi:hypothetical protein
VLGKVDCHWGFSAASYGQISYGNRKYGAFFAFIEALKVLPAKPSG